MLEQQERVQGEEGGRDLRTGGCALHAVLAGPDPAASG